MNVVRLRLPRQQCVRRRRFITKLTTVDAAETDCLWLRFHFSNISFRASLFIAFILLVIVD